MKDNVAYIIQQMIQINGHKPVKKALQKTVFLIEQKGVDLGFEYTLHFYGPYSAKLDQETSALNAEGVISFEYSQFGHKIDIETQETIEDENLTRIQMEIINDVIEHFKSRSASELELLTTAIYAYDRIGAHSRHGVYENVKRIKGEKYTDAEISWAINEFPYFEIAI